MNKRLEDHEKRIAALERQLEDGKVATTQIKDAWMSALDKFCDDFQVDKPKELLDWIESRDKLRKH